jgi:hypothetical protein
MNFGEALENLKLGHKACRNGWYGKGMWLECQTPDRKSKMTHPYLFMNILECEEGPRKLPWQPAQVDLFANDWMIV